MLSRGRYARTKTKMADERHVLAVNAIFILLTSLTVAVMLFNVDPFNPRKTSAPKNRPRSKLFVGGLWQNVQNK